MNRTLRTSEAWPKTGDVFRYVSLQYHCLVSLESELQVSKVGPGENPMNHRSEQMQGPCGCCIEVKVSIKEVYFGQAAIILM